VKVIGVSNATAIAAGFIHSCALIAGGGVKCWGTNQYGLLGNGTQGHPSPIPVTVHGLSNAIAIVSGGGHNCALNSDGIVKCWGRIKYANANEKGSPVDSSIPVTVTGLSKAIAISAGSRHTCAIISDGTVKCWGRNDFGQLGDGTTANSLTPVMVIGISKAKAVATGDVHSCALISDGTVKCWGINGLGILGNETNKSPQACGNSPCSTTPMVVSDISTAIAITAGKEHTCKLLLGGTVKCWGWNKYGQLGNGRLTEFSKPVEVAGLLE
jgi:alpha-tubulin suppressor-like RCC1 family protein